MPEKTSIDFKNGNKDEIRPEELIIQIYKNKIDLKEKGIHATRIIMSMSMFRTIKKYHAGLGEVSGNFSDYINEDEIFGIPVFIDQTDIVIVE